MRDPTDYEHWVDPAEIGFDDEEVRTPVHEHQVFIKEEIAETDEQTVAAVAAELFGPEPLHAMS